MIYADTDFFLALLKEKDWLRERAIDLYQEHRTQLSTSVATVIELLLLAKRLRINPEQLLVNAFALVPKVIGIDKNTAFSAAHCIKEKNINVFDALHGAYCDDQEMISSDHVFDRIGIKRIKLEQ